MELERVAKSTAQYREESLGFFEIEVARHMIRTIASHPRSSTHEAVDNPPK